MAKFHRIILISESLKEWNASFRSKTDSTSHLELPSIKNVSLSKGYTRLSLAILTFQMPEIHYYSFVISIFLLINMTGLEYTGKSSFIIPR